MECDIGDELIIAAVGKMCCFSEQIATCTINVEQVRVKFLQLKDFIVVKSQEVDTSAQIREMFHRKLQFIALILQKIHNFVIHIEHIVQNTRFISEVVVLVF